MCLAVPGRIIELEGDDALSRTARVSFGGIIRQVSLACVPEAAVDDYVIVHVGIALAVVDQQEAESALSDLAELQKLGEVADINSPLQ
jgi:hydrogenase expression/formation protein HypC